MGNFVGTFKRFFENKNTVTIVAIIVGIAVLVYFYNYRVSNAVSTTKVPYAKVTIKSGKKIENDNEVIAQRVITNSALRKSEIVTNASELDGKYVCLGNTIPEGSYILRSQLCDEKDINNAIFGKIDDGYTLYGLDVNLNSTYANSIKPGSKIDLYMSAKDTDGKVIYGPLIKSIEVLAVRDSSGKTLFSDPNAGNSSLLLFAVPEKYQRLLNVADLISGSSVQITPVPRSASYTANPGETEISNRQLCMFIMNYYSNFGDLDASTVCND